MHYLLRLKASAYNELYPLYKEAVEKHNQMCDGEFFDAGFDLFCPADIEVDSRATVKINQEVKGEMRFISSSSSTKHDKAKYDN